MVPSNDGVQPPLRAACHLQKTNDLVRAAVGWNDLFGAPVALLRVVDRMR